MAAAAAAGGVAVDVGLCLLYVALNAGLNFSNRWALGVHDFSFPLVLTAGHMLLNPVFLAPLLLLAPKYRNEHGRILWGHWRSLLLIAAFNGVQIALNNSSLVHIELSLNQVVRATMPVMVALLELFRGTPPSLSQLPVLAIIATGVILVVYQPAPSATSSSQSEAEVERAWLLGTLLVTASVSLQAAQMSFAGSLLSVKLDSFQITFYTSPAALLTLVGPTALLEAPKFREYLATKLEVACGVILGTCLLAVAYNVVMFQTIRRLGPVGSAVLGNVKIVLLLLLSSLLMGEMKQWTRQQYLGTVLTFVGAAAYSAQKLRGSAASKKGH